MPVNIIPSIGYYQEAEVGESKAAMTVDAGPDTGYNNCVAAYYPGSLRHASTKGAIDNLMGMIVSLAEAKQAGSGSKGPPHIAGHGDSGFMTTGCGQDGPQTPDNTIGTWNEYVWGPEFERLKAKNYAILTLLTCTTGADQEGAELLFAIAKRSGKPVRARTGLTYCGGSGITYAEGSTWQVATPTMKPNPIPKTHAFNRVSTEILIMNNATLALIDPNAVKSVEIHRRNKSLGTTSLSDTLSGDEVKGLLSMIDFAKPFAPGGVPGAMVNVEITLNMESEPQKRHFLIYNYTVAQDTDHPEIFYHVNYALRGMLE